MSTFLRTVDSYQQGAQTLGREYYDSPDIFAREMNGIWKRRWLCVGRVEQIAKPGQYFLVDIAGENLIVVRANDGKPRAFFNVCRHRGTRICDEQTGSFRETIQCPYHAWTYNLTGELIGAPHMQGADNFDMGDYPLHEAGIAEWEGLLYVNLGAEREPFEQQYEPLIDRFRRFNLPALRSVKRIEYEVAANWKLLFLNFSECLHCPMIHPTFSKKTPYQSGFNDFDDGPFLGGYMLINEESMTMSGLACGTTLGTLLGDDMKRAYYYSLFPNVLLSLFPDYAMTHTIWPVGPQKTRIVCEWLFHPDAISAPGFNPSDAIQFWDITNREDWHITERTQAGILSSAYTRGPYSPRESLLAAWDREYLRQLGELVP